MMMHSNAITQNPSSSTWFRGANYSWYYRRNVAGPSIQGRLAKCFEIAKTVLRWKVPRRWSKDPEYGFVSGLGESLVRRWSILIIIIAIFLRHKNQYVRFNFVPSAMEAAQSIDFNFHLILSSSSLSRSGCKTEERAYKIVLLTIITI